jgi:hypothetical protein
MVTNTLEGRGYVCSGANCSVPAEDVSSWSAILDSLHPMTPA